MNALYDVYKLSGLLTLIADVIALWYVVPAFRRTGNKAFLFLIISAVLGIFDTVCNHTIGIRLHDTKATAFITYKLVMYGFYFANLFFGTTGLVLLVRPYLTDSTSKCDPDQTKS